MNDAKRQTHRNERQKVRARIKAVWIIWGIAFLVTVWQTFDLMHILSGWHLAIRVALNVIVLASLFMSCFVARKSN